MTRNSLCSKRVLQYTVLQNSKLSIFTTFMQSKIQIQILAYLAYDINPLRKMCFSRSMNICTIFISKPFYNNNHTRTSTRIYDFSVLSKQIFTLKDIYLFPVFFKDSFSCKYAGFIMHYKQTLRLLNINI